MSESNVGDGDSENDWLVIENKRSFKLKSHWSSVYCNTRRIASLSYKLYKKGAKGLKLFNQLIWLNYSMYPYLPPKVGLSLSLALVCVFLVSK